MIEGCRTECPRETLNLEIHFSCFSFTAAMSLQSCPTVCDPIDGSPPGSPVPGILQARTLEWVAISFSNASKWKVKSESEVAQSCPILSNPMDCSLPGSSVHRIFQARVLEWGAIAFSSFSFSRHWKGRFSPEIYKIEDQAWFSPDLSTKREKKKKN